MLTPVLISVAVTISIFVIGLAYSAGLHSGRITHLEKWREEFRQEIKEQFTEVHGHMLRFEDVLNTIRTEKVKA